MLAAALRSHNARIVPAVPRASCMLYSNDALTRTTNPVAGRATPHCVLGNFTPNLPAALVWARRVAIGATSPAPPL